MNDTDRKFWPFKPRTSIVFAIFILVDLLIIFVALRATINWPFEKSETTVLIGILLISLLPIVLALIDANIERGGTIEDKDVKIKFA